MLLKYVLSGGCSLGGAEHYSPNQFFFLQYNKVQSMTSDCLLLVQVRKNKSGKIPRIDIKNDNIKKKREISNSQSAEVCKNYLTASQRIYAKELWYILGLFEADGSLSCYKEKEHIRLDLTIGLEEKDAKLTHWIKKHMGHGQVKIVKYSNNPNKNLSRYTIRSKVEIVNTWFQLFDDYPLLTKNKRAYYNWIKASLEQKEVLSKANYFTQSPKPNTPQAPPCFTRPLGFTVLQGKPLQSREAPQNVNLKETSCGAVWDVKKNPYIKDWIIGFIEGDGSFYFYQINPDPAHPATRSAVQGKTGFRAGFNIGQMHEANLLKKIGEIMGLSGKNKISTKKNNYSVLTAVSLQDIQAVVDFICDKERVRLKGLKKVKFLIWLKELRVNPRYSGLRIPDTY